MRVYSQGLSYLNVAPWDVKHILKTYTPFHSPLNAADCTMMDKRLVDANAVIQLRSDTIAHRLMCIIAHV